MFQRRIQNELKQLAKQYPIVTIIGPHQSGKTTLIKHAFPEKPYANLEELDTRNLAISDPRSFLDSYPKGVILDEIQRAPELLSYIQSRVDALGKKRFLFSYRKSLIRASTSYHTIFSR